jgi:hypothetical protein
LGGFNMNDETQAAIASETMAADDTQAADALAW